MMNYGECIIEVIGGELIITIRESKRDIKTLPKKCHAKFHLTAIPIDDTLIPILLCITNNTMYELWIVDDEQYNLLRDQTRIMIRFFDDVVLRTISFSSLKVATVASCFTPKIPDNYGDYMAVKGYIQSHYTPFDLWELSPPGIKELALA